MELIKGCLYQVIESLQFGDHFIDDKIIYLGCQSDWMIYDRFPEYLIGRMYHFFDPETGKTPQWNVNGKEDFQTSQVTKHLKEVPGGWPRPKQQEGITSPIKSVDKSKGKELLKEYTHYFKSIIEGDKNAYNFYYWLEENEQLLSAALTGGEKLQLRLEPFSNLK